MFPTSMLGRLLQRAFEISPRHVMSGQFLEIKKAVRRRRAVHDFIHELFRRLQTHKPAAVTKAADVFCRS